MANNKQNLYSDDLLPHCHCNRSASTRETIVRGALHVVVLVAMVMACLFLTHRQMMLNAEIAVLKTELETMRHEFRIGVLLKEEGGVQEEDLGFYEEEEDSDYQSDYEEEEIGDEGELLTILNQGAVRSRLRRDTVLTADPTQKSKRNKKRKGKKSKKGRSGRTERTKITAAHIIPKNFSHHHEELMREDEVAVDCGKLKSNGLQVHCATATYWQLDRETSKGHRLVDLVNGVVLIKHPGLYYLYSQMTHHDQLGSWSYAVNMTRDGQDTILTQCPGMEPHIHSSTETNRVYPVQFQCHTSLAVRLEMGDQLKIYNMYYAYGNRVVRLEKHLTFWGLIRMAP